MPAPLANVDWDHLRDLYCAGLTFKSIADQTGISHDAIRAHAGRYGWKTSVTQAQATVSQAVTASLAERGRHWSGRIASLVETHLGQLERLESLDLDQLERLVRCLKGLDDIGRRTFCLDEPATRESGWARSGPVIEVVEIPPVDPPAELPPSSG